MSDEKRSETDPEEGDLELEQETIDDLEVSSSGSRDGLIIAPNYSR